MLRFALLALLSTSPLAAQTAAPARSGGTAPTAGDHHEEADASIVVTAPFEREQEDLLSGVSVVTGEELVRELRPTIGETLARQPGVSATSFGPNASRPVLRGFQGERIRVLTDGIGSFDVSNTSVDHPVAINPLTAERIEVLRGPSALLFGSSAIGGVVNVLDARIPRRLPNEPIHVEALGTLGSAARERSASGKVDLPVGRLVLHADGTYLNTNDLRIAGFVLSPELRAQAAARDDAGVRSLATLRDRLPNSGNRLWEVAGGASAVVGDSHVGFSVNRLDNLFAIPVRYSLEPGGEAEAVRIDAKQTRVDLRGEIATGGSLFDRVRLRAGAADYQHAELEETGEVGTRFFSSGYEGRAEFVQRERGNWRGAIGGQFFLRDLNIVGEEKFLPTNETQQYGIFTLQEVDLGALRVEGGARLERAYLSAQADEALGTDAARRTFTALSGSLGASVGLAEGVRLGVIGSRSERAPSAEELFANGPHAGTQTFEIGDPGFVKEKSWGLEASLRGERSGIALALNAYLNDFHDFIYESFGDEEPIDGLPVLRYAQADARYYGFEAEASARLGRFGGVAIVADAVADYTRATIKGQGPAPRIPPLRVLGGVEAQADGVAARLEAEHVARQDRNAASETETRGFTLVNASLSFAPFGRENGTTLLLSANNIFDVDARRHASLLKDLAPLAGRDVRVSARVRF